MSPVNHPVAFARLWSTHSSWREERDKSRLLAVGAESL
jgi:hypothetical protein